jgi:hypothetical protein
MKMAPEIEFATSGTGIYLDQRRILIAWPAHLPVHGLGLKQRRAPGNDPIGEEAPGQQGHEDGILLGPRPVERVVRVVGRLRDQHRRAVLCRLELRSVGARRVGAVGAAPEARLLLDDVLAAGLELAVARVPLRHLLARGLGGLGRKVVHAGLIAGIAWNLEEALGITARGVYPLYAIQELSGNQCSLVTRNTSGVWYPDMKGHTARIRRRMPPEPRPHVRLLLQASAQTGGHVARCGGKTAIRPRMCLSWRPISSPLTIKLDGYPASSQMPP